MSKTTLMDIGLYKSRLIQMILSSPEIAGILLNRQDGRIAADELTYSQVFPYLHTDETQTEILSYICVEADVSRMLTGTMKEMKLTLWVYAHKECMDYTLQGYSGTRVDILSDIIDRLISDEAQCRRFGIGVPSLISSNYFIPQNKYYGKQLIYTIPDFKTKKAV